MFFIHYILMVAQQVAHPQSLETRVSASSAQAVQTKRLSYGEKAATHGVEEPLSYTCYIVHKCHKCLVMRSRNNVELNADLSDWMSWVL